MNNRNVSIVTDLDGRKIVFIHDILFKGKRKVDWKEVKNYLKNFVGKCYEIEENAEKIYLGGQLPMYGKKIKRRDMRKMQNTVGIDMMSDLHYLFTMMLEKL